MVVGFIWMHAHYAKKILLFSFRIFGKRQRRFGFLLHSIHNVFWLRVWEAKAEVQKMQAVLPESGVVGAVETVAVL